MVALIEKQHKVTGMNSSLVLINQEHEGISIVTLNRPEKRNALSIELMAQVRNAVLQIQGTPGQRAIIFQGAGAVFCAGLDLNEAANADLALKSAEAVQGLLDTIAGTPLVSIAAVHGAAVAGGAGLMSACDFVVAAEGTHIGYPEVRRGLVAGMVLTFLQRQLRERDVRELLITGELIDAKRALHMGLVNRVAAEDHVMAEALAFAKAAMKGAPGAIAHSKHLLNHIGFAPIEQDIQRAMRHHLQARNSKEAAEGIKAFLEKRDPNWVK